MITGESLPVVSASNEPSGHTCMDVWRLPRQAGSYLQMGGVFLMKKKFIGKIIIDMIMTVLLLSLMARQLTGDSAHEWLGAGM